MPLALDPAMINELTRAIDHELIELRRNLHRHPELAGEERRSSALVADRLRAAGLAVTTGVGGHGVVAVLDGAKAGPTVAYRADLDAVDDDELFDCDFASQIPGAAHLCGHDLHTAIGVGIALIMARLRNQVNGRVVFVFQPAEETFEGALSMIDEGFLERTTPQEIYALHCGPLPVGTFAVGPGQPGQDRVRIELAGADAAGDAERVVAMINGLTTVGRPETPGQLHQLMDDLQTPDGPLSRFVFALSSMNSGDDGARVDAWLRVWPEDRQAELRDEVRRQVGDLTGMRLEFTAQPFPAMVCTPELNAAATSYLQGVLGAEAVTVLHAAYPFNGDDFAYFLHHVPGAMFYLGVADPDAGINGVPHAPDFAADERAIGIGVAAMTGLLADRLDVLAIET
jgi:amidohydrolase